MRAPRVVACWTGGALGGRFHWTGRQATKQASRQQAALLCESNENTLKTTGTAPIPM
jgi:hypothetical protein